SRVPFRRASSPEKLDHIEIAVVAGLHQADELDVKIGLRSLQRQRQEKLAKCRHRHARLGAAGKPETLAIDNGGMNNTPDGNIRKGGTVTWRRTGFPASGLIRHITLVDLVAVHVISAWKIGIAGGTAVEGWRLAAIAAVVDLPIRREVPSPIAHAS